MPQTAETAKPQSMTWPTFKAAVIAWLDQHGKTPRNENAAYNILHAARDFGSDVVEVMQMQAYAAQHIGKYAELSAKTCIRALQFHIERDYYAEQGETERAADLTRRLAYWGA